MDEIKNVTLEEVLALKDTFPVKPRRNRAIITVNVAEADGELVLNNGSFAESQYIVACSDNITDLEAGQKVLIDLEKMMIFEKAEENSDERVGMLKLHPVEVDGIIYALVSENVILATDAR